MIAPCPCVEYQREQGFISRVQAITYYAHMQHMLGLLQSVEQEPDPVVEIDPDPFFPRVPRLFIWQQDAQTWATFPGCDRGAVIQSLEGRYFTTWNHEGVGHSAHLTMKDARNSLELRLLDRPTAWQLVNG